MSFKQVKVYSISTCHYCKMAKEFLDENNIPYQDIDVTTDKSLRDEMIEKSGQMSVPQIYIDGALVIGFDKLALEEKLGLV